MEAKRSTTFTLTPECKRLIRLLAHNLGISQTAVIELAVRDMAESRKLPTTPCIKSPT
jgi:hypothetical protein